MQIGFKLLLGAKLSLRLLKPTRGFSSLSSLEQDFGLHLNPFVSSDRVGLLVLQVKSPMLLCKTKLMEMYTSDLLYAGSFSKTELEP